MKNIAVAFIFCLTSTIANAQIGPQFRQIPKNVLCGPVEIIFKALVEEDINEKPIWTGKNEDDKSDYAIFVNPKTSAFTIVQFGKEWGCILGIGFKSQQFSNITKNL